MSPMLRTATRQSLVSVMSDVSARSTATWSPTSATLWTLPRFRPFTCTSSLELRPPVCGNVTCHTRTRRASVSCLSQVTPHSVTPSATSTVMPTWISLVRLKVAPQAGQGWRDTLHHRLHHADRTLAHALNELLHQQVAGSRRFGGRARELHAALVQQRQPVADLPRAV